VPAQTTPELLFYRRDLFAEAGLEPPPRRRKAAPSRTKNCMSRAGALWHRLERRRGTALGHTF
jgi:multiple sugar transport system substrate-binding protein